MLPLSMTMAFLYSILDCADGTTFGKKCIYKCKDGTKSVGSGAELSVTCEADSMWSPITIFCRRICLLPPTPPHSKLLSKDCHKGKPFMPGESCKYRCKPGYRPSGLYTRELYRKGDFVQRCLKGGTWTTKRCVLLTCPVRDPKIFRWYNCTLGSTFGSVCRLACPGEKVGTYYIYYESVLLSRNGLTWEVGGDRWGVRERPPPPDSSKGAGGVPIS